MSWESIILYIVVPLALIVIRFFMSRFEQLEDKLLTKISEGAVRTIIDDKLDPLRVSISEIKEDVAEIKHILHKLYTRRQ